MMGVAKQLHRLFYKTSVTSNHADMILMWIKPVRLHKFEVVTLQ